MTIRFGNKLRFKTYLGDIKEGIVKGINPDGSFYVEIDEQLIPDLHTDILIHDSKGRPFTIYKAKFPNWQAWVKPEWVIANLTQERKERLDVV